MAYILVIEDDDSVRAALGQTLERLGHEVSTASNGKEGLKKALDRTPDLVVTDLIMPETEGLETIIELRRRSPQVRIIAISGGGRLSNDNFLGVARKFGAHGTLAKPFSREELRAAIDAALSD
jgi:DNA-binding response OmpR family regulator